MRRGGGAGRLRRYRFALAATAREAWRDGAGTAVDAFDEALGLWAGEPYLDRADWPPAQGEIARLGELRRTLVEDRLGARLGQGLHLGAVAETPLDAQFAARAWKP